jgi:integrase
MAVAKITIRTVEQLEPGSRVWDTVVQGFGVRRQRDGAYYYLRFRKNGAQQMRSIGRHGSPWTPERARNEAIRLLGALVGGDDPFTKPLASESFGHEVQRYLDRKRQMMKPRAFEEVERHLTNHASPLHKLRLAEIDRRTIAQRLGEIETASGPVARNRVRSSLSAFFSWAVTEGLLDANPVQGTAKLDEGGSRERTLTPEELRELWSALDHEPNPQFADIVRLLILTGQRREEIGGLRWSEIERGLIVMPPERTKNSRQHEVPLSRQAKEILERHAKRKGRDFIFGIGELGFSGWSDCKARLDQALLAARRHTNRKAKPMPDWRLHDLRRTCATGMAELGVMPNVIELALNHVSGHKAGVAGIYNRSKMPDAVREALQRWADHLEALTVGPPKQPVPTGLMERAFAVARGGKIVPNDDLANLTRHLKKPVTH